MADAGRELDRGAETQLPAIVVGMGKVAVYVAMTLAGAGVTATLYRFGPSRRSATWVWLAPGFLFAALAWLLLTVGFGLYVANFGNYSSTYGSLGAVVVMLTWLCLSSYILVFGAELNPNSNTSPSATSIPWPRDPRRRRNRRSRYGQGAIRPYRSHRVRDSSHGGCSSCRRSRYRGGGVVAVRSPCCCWQASRQ